jgi:hypothetical protein
MMMRDTHGMHKERHSECVNDRCPELGKKYVTPFFEFEAVLAQEQKP